MPVRKQTNSNQSRFPNIFMRNMKKSFLSLSCVASISLAAKLSTSEVSSELKSGHFKTLKISQPSHSLKLLNDDVIEDLCDSDMKLINDNEDLVRDLKNISDTFEEVFNATPFNYCAGSRAGSLVTMRCEVDYDDFSTEYNESCSDLGGMTYPVTLLMMCASTVMDLEFKLVRFILIHFAFVDIRHDM